MVVVCWTPSAYALDPRGSVHRSKDDACFLDGSLYARGIEQVLAATPTTSSKVGLYGSGDGCGGWWYAAVVAVLAVVVVVVVVMVVVVVVRRGGVVMVMVVVVW